MYSLCDYNHPCVQHLAFLCTVSNMHSVRGLMHIKAVDNQNHDFVPTFRTKVSHHVFFTQMGKSLGSGGKKVGSGHRNQTYFFFLPYYNPRIKCVLYDKEYSH